MADVFNVLTVLNILTSNNNVLSSLDSCYLPQVLFAFRIQGANARLRSCSRKSMKKSLAQS